jgi:hypothetical protein
MRRSPAGMRPIGELLDFFDQLSGRGLHEAGPDGQNTHLSVDGRFTMRRRFHRSRVRLRTSDFDVV